MIKIDNDIRSENLSRAIDRVFSCSAQKIDSIEASWRPGSGAPVFTVKGKYTARGWTEWTQGFQYGSAVLQFDATGEKKYLEIGRDRTVEGMASHVTHFGVHDHGFNNVSTYGNLLRLMQEGKTPENPWERHFYEMALKASGAVQARRWTDLGGGRGYIYSFNGPQSLFADTVRSLRALALAHSLGHCLMGEKDVKVSLLDRLLEHARTTAEYTVYYGEGRDTYDIRGRVAHESIFNLNDGSYRCPNSQQGFSPFTTWTRGLAWIMLGYPEQLEYLETLPEDEFASFGGKQQVLKMVLKAACACCDFYIEHTPLDGIPYWDTGAPELYKLGEYLNKTADPFNDYEPVDSSAAAIGAQGLLRLGRYLKERDSAASKRYWQAGLTVAETLMKEPYLSDSPSHQGLLLHSVYHRPNGWDYIPEGRKIPCGESSMWGDYHLRELALYLKRILNQEKYYTFFGAVKPHEGRD